ncbi:Pentatricopeptide repeat-containing protein -mitochondrial [Striga hermonthica]|uniref:Pentatricopeptide repeat-containing protein -mitochondrial n=1 Tax=Striga hermonthica TaxID=68872 RepID=A0A9N7RRE2_STRHE|nr:Pentatricopeptide repeat-containing protein -mitochondrial [Striga hermonthica]
MSRTRPLPSTVQFNQLLSRVVNLKEYSAAINLFKDICSLGVSVDEYTMNIAINGLCLSGLFREKRINESQELLRKMVGEGLSELNIVTCGIVVDGLCKDRMIDSALALLKEMPEKDILPNVVTYSSLISGLCNFRRWEDVKADEGDGVVPDISECGHVHHLY